MSDPVAAITSAKEELEQLSKVPLSDMPAQSRRDLAVVAHLLQAARRRCGIKDEQQARAPVSKSNGRR